MTFNDLQNDVLTELLNVGVGKGVVGLSMVMGQEVIVSIPSIKIHAQVKVANILTKKNGQKLACI